MAQITATQQKNLTTLFADKAGKAAFSRLRATLNAKADVIQQVTAENEFLITAAIIFNECASNATSISGQEEAAHNVLHYILKEHLNVGDNALGQIEHTFSPV